MYTNIILYNYVRTLQISDDLKNKNEGEIIQLFKDLS